MIKCFESILYHILVGRLTVVFREGSKKRTLKFSTDIVSLF